MKRVSPTLIAAVGVVGIAGFLIGRQSASGPESSGDPSSAGDRPRLSSSAESMTEPGERRSSSRSSSRQDGPAAAAATRFQGAAALARMEEIVRGDDPLARGRALLAFIDQLDPGDFEATVAHFRSLGITDDRFGEYGMLLAAWAKADPRQALEYVSANTSGGFALNTVISTWAAQDPEGAIAWAESKHQGDGPNRFMPGIIRAIAATDINRASQLLTAMPRSYERGEALDGFLGHLLKSGTENAKNWAAGLSDEALKSGTISRLADKLAATDPAGTARWLLAAAPNLEDSGMGSVMGRWAKTNQAEATKFFDGLPAGAMRGEAFRGLISSVTLQNPQAGAALIDRNPSDLSNGAIRSFVWHSLDKDPALALTYIGRLPDKQDQERYYDRSLRFWMERDAAAAQTWMQSNPVPPAVVERLRSEDARRK